ncbi:MAG: hypothetical protein LIO46_07780, partial [Clostridiales bacterium]|nr:hypothetical protein [Clostridiales bacterium]
ARVAQGSGPDELLHATTLYEKKNRLYVKVVNPDSIAKRVTIRLNGFSLPDRAAAVILSDGAMESTTCAPKSYMAALHSGQIAQTLPACSFVVYEIDLRAPAD